MTIPVWLLIVLPLAGAAILLLSGQRYRPVGSPAGLRRRRWRRSPSGRCCSSTCSAGPARTGRSHEKLFSWVPVGGLQVDFGLQLDQLSMCFVLLITGVGSLIHIYSVGYMAEDPAAPTVFRLSEPLPGRDAAAGARRQLPGPLRRLGRRGPGVLPADRVLAAQAVGGHRGQEGVRGQPRRRRRPCRRADGDVRLHRLDFVPRGLRRRTAAGPGHAQRHRPAAPAGRMRQVRTGAAAVLAR